MKIKLKKDLSEVMYKMFWVVIVNWGTYRVKFVPILKGNLI